MDFKDKDFEKLQFNCHPIPHGKDMLKEFPELSRYDEFTKEIEDRNKVIRFVIYCYDKKSPLQVEKNVTKRKVIACQLAGFEAKEGKFDEKVEAIISNGNDDVNRMICRYVRNQKNMQYSLLVAGMEQFFDNVLKLSQPTADQNDMQELKRKAELFQLTSGMISSLEESAENIFNGDAKLMYVADDIEGEETGRIKSYPEYIATLREEGILNEEFKKVIPNPHFTGE